MAQHPQTATGVSSPLERPPPRSAREDGTVLRLKGFTYWNRGGRPAVFSFGSSQQADWLADWPAPLAPFRRWTSLAVLKRPAGVPCYSRARAPRCRPRKVPWRPGSTKAARQRCLKTVKTAPRGLEKNGGGVFSSSLRPNRNNPGRATHLAGHVATLDERSRPCHSLIAHRRPPTQTERLSRMIGRSSLNGRPCG